jgi:negative regulator of replication initiation
MKMIAIEIDEEVDAALRAEARGFGQTHNSVLRRDYLGDGKNGQVTMPTQVPNVVTFVRDRKFQALGRGLERFLALLSWLHGQHPGRFDDILALPFGGRKYFGKSGKEILDTVRGDIKVRQIPGSPYWVMVTFSNDDKKKILRQVMRFLGYGSTEIEDTMRELPDSRGRQIIDLQTVLR